MSFARPFVLLTAALLAACASAGQDPSTSAPNAPPASAEQTRIARGLAFATEQCSGCHALVPGEEPPNPQAPSFVAVANDMGFDPATLREFFLDKHDTPAQMTIELEEEQAEIVSAYIMSLRTPR